MSICKNVFLFKGKTLVRLLKFLEVIPKTALAAKMSNFFRRQRGRNSHSRSYCDAGRDSSTEKRAICSPNEVLGWLLINFAGGGFDTYRGNENFTCKLPRIRVRKTFLYGSKSDRAGRLNGRTQGLARITIQTRRYVNGNDGAAKIVYRIYRLPVTTP